MFGFFNVGVEVAKIVQPWRVFVVLNDWQLTGLRQLS